MTDLNRLAQTLEQLRTAAARGVLVDLSDLMPEIERACTEAREAGDSSAAAAGLQDLARSLDALHGELARAEEATRRNAMEAYSG
jgi:uncharacterized membrane protein YccC